MMRQPTIAHTFDERLDDRKRHLEEALRSQADPATREQLERKLGQIETARNINQWLTSPGLKSPE